MEIRIRDPETFPEELKILLDILTFNEIPKVVGSYSYKNHKYPSDVDVFEKITLNLDKEQAAIFYTNMFKNIIERLLINDSIYFISDFKCGLDSNGDPIRWSGSEIINGYAIRNGIKYLFNNSVQDRAITKLDVISWISGKFQSVEVFYDLRYKNGVFYPLGDYAKNLMNDILKYSSDDYKNPLKVIKRLWSLSRLKNCNELIGTIDPLLSSDVAALNQINSDIDIIININQILYRNIKHQSTLYDGNVREYKNIKYYENFTKMISQTLGLKKKIHNHLHDDGNMEIGLVIDNIYKIWNQYLITGFLDLMGIEINLKKVRTVLLTDINIKSENYLNYVTNLNTSCKLDLKLR